MRELWKMELPVLDVVLKIRGDLTNAQGCRLVTDGEQVSNGYFIAMIQRQCFHLETRDFW